MKDLTHSEALNTHVAALSYVVLMLIQRMEKTQAGLSQELIAGIKADKEASHAASQEIVDAFNKAIQIIEQASLSTTDSE